MRQPRKSFPPKSLALPAIAAVLLCCLALGAASDATATSGFRDSWLSAYPDACPTLKAAANSCALCHTAPPDLNPYGESVVGNRTTLTATNDLDPDADTFTNLEEINACTLPGDVTSHPVPLDETTWGLIKVLYR